MIQLGTLAAADIPAVLRVQRACYRDELIESADSFLKKLALYGAGCRGAWTKTRLSGYVFAHPWRVGDVVDLDSDSYVLPADANCMYVHDLAVDPSERQQSIASRLFQAVVAVAEERGLNRFALVAVQNSEPFWSRWGFSVQREFPYAPGVPASYMLSEELPKWR